MTFPAHVRIRPGESALRLAELPSRRVGPDQVRVRIAAADFTRHGCDLVYLVSEVGSGREVARAKTGMVFFDYDAQKIASMPERFRARVVNA